MNPPEPVYTTRLVPIEELKPYDRNARTHSRKQIRQIAASIKAFGFVTPVVIDGQNRILAGHGRVQAAKSLMMEAVPTIQIDHLNEDEIRAYILADNKIAENAGWDKSMVAHEVKHLMTLINFDPLTIGFDEHEIETIISCTVEIEQGEDDVLVDLNSQPVTKTGDCWYLDDHCIVCGDATNPDDLAYLMNGDKAAMVFTDPPYNVAYKGGGGGGSGGGKRRPIENDDLGGAFGTFLTSVCRNLLSVTDGALYVCMSSSELHVLQKAFVDAGGHWSTFLIWAKNTFTLGRSDYQRQYEPILYGWKEGGGHYWCGDRGQGDILFFDKPARNDIHPTMKPVGLVIRAIRNSSEPGGIVLDVFLGSGTTLIAAERTKRVCYGLELDPLYVDAAVRRWQRHTGRKAVHAETKKTFDETQAAMQVKQ